MQVFILLGLRAVLVVWIVNGVRSLELREIFFLNLGSRLANSGVDRGCSPVETRLAGLEIVDLEGV